MKLLAIQLHKHTCEVLPKGYADVAFILNIVSTKNLYLKIISKNVARQNPSTYTNHFHEIAYRRVCTL